LRSTIFWAAALGRTTEKFAAEKYSKNQKIPGANPTIAINNASVVNF
jgi:hypothetical protein